MMFEIVFEASDEAVITLKALLASSPHHVYDHPPERLLLLLGQVLEDIAVFLLQQFEAHG